MIKNGQTVDLDIFDATDPSDVIKEPKVKTYSAEERRRIKYKYARANGIDPDSIDVDKYGRIMNVLLVRGLINHTLSIQ